MKGKKSELDGAWLGGFAAVFKFAVSRHITGRERFGGVKKSESSET